MASVTVQKTANGKAWRTMWRDKQGKQRQRNFTKKREADAYAAQLKVDLTTGAYIDPRLARTTVGAQYVYWQTHRVVSRGRQALEASAATRHLVPRWGDVALEDVTFDAAQAWVNDLSFTYSRQHVVSCYRLLSQTMQSAVRSRKLPANPVEDVKIPAAPRKALTWEDVLTAFELGAVAEQTEERWSAFVFCSGWLGWRLSEGLGIRRCDVNLLRNEITIGRVVIEEVGGQSNARRGGKTDAAVRVVPLPPTVAKVLERHLMEQVDDPSPEAFLFVQANGFHPSRSNLLRRTLYPALARAGIVPTARVKQHEEKREGREPFSGWQVKWYDSSGKLVTRVVRDEKEAADLAAQHGGSRSVDFRQLRHTAASLMIDAGLDPVDVCQRLGHARPSITMDIYTHLFSSKASKGTAALEDAIQQAGAR